MARLRFSSVNITLFLYFAGLAAVGSFLLQLPFAYTAGKAVPYIDALFTAVSALCVTGLSTVDMGVYTLLGFFFILFLIEAGGLGLMTFFIFYLVLPTHKISLVNRHIVRDYFISDIEAEPRKIISRIFIYTFAVQASGALMLFFQLRAAGERHAIFYSIFLSVSAFCNAGFAPYSDNLHRFSGSMLCMTIAFLIVMGGLGFTVMQDMAQNLYYRLHGKKRRVSFHSKIVFVMSGLLIFIPAFIFFFSEKNHAFSSFSTAQRACDALFQSITARTAGFETVAQSSLSSLASLITTLLMFVGGSPGSMAGGIKTTTLFLVFCYAFRSQDDQNLITVFKHDIPDSASRKAAEILIKACLFLCTAAALLCITEHAALSDGNVSLGSLIFETVSAFGTVGLSKGATMALSTTGKLVIIATMFFGRTGIITMTLSFRSTANNLKRLVDFPQSPVLVG